VAKSKPIKKKVITTRSSSKDGTKVIKTIPKNKVRSKKSSSTRIEDLPFGKRNFQLAILGAVLILVGMLLMMGGGMPSPDVWDESLIYSFRRITLAPIVIIAGLIVEIFAIFSDK